ncbi:MAG: PD40 domain-containing protein [Gemmatimonadota bacterium]|nr:MAG: PD40 domain-containing protein [Gemmatimonadota bacterium]
MTLHSRCNAAIVLFAALLSAVVFRPVIAQSDGWRTIEFETTEVTAADVAVSPDGQWLIFTIVGHLFRVPVEGGTAEQLTFGPYYHSDPVFSPDGSRVAFVSDRDGNEGNIFVLEPATGEITQVTHEPWASRPAWTPDGQAIVYLSFPGGLSVTWRGSLVPALVRRIPLQGGEPETLTASPRLFRSVFYVPDGRLAWLVVEREGGRRSPHTARIEIMSPQGAVSSARTLDGDADRAVPSPAGDGLYWRRRSPRSSGAEAKDLTFLPLPDGAERPLFPMSGRAYWDPQFAVAADNKSLYLGQDGRLWKIGLPVGTRELIPFRARVSLEVHAPTPPPRWAPTRLRRSTPPRSVMWPRLSPDGRRLVFGAAHYLWHQPIDGGVAERLFAGSSFEWSPAFSPDGRQLAFIHRRFETDEVRVFDFGSRQTRTVASAPLLLDPSWSPDGQRLVFAERQPGGRRVVVVNVNDGSTKVLSTSPGATYAPHFAADGQSVYVSDLPGGGTVYRLSLERGASSQPIIQLARPLNRGLISPDGSWLAFGRNSEMQVAPLGADPIEEEDLRQLSPRGASTFALTPDGSAVIYATGNQVWRHSLAGGEREEIPIRLELPRPTPPPVLVRGVRVLDFAAGGFGAETSLFIEQGRIRWIGPERGRRLPRETVIVEGGGRYAIPGLFDMHVHATMTRAPLQVAWLAYGVTSVRDLNGGLPWLHAMADRSEATNQPVPRYFFAGNSFHGHSSPPTYGEPRVHTEDEARTLVRRWKEWGAQLIKAYTQLSWPVRRAVSEEARRQGLPVAGHSDYLELTTKSVTLGYASLEHTPGRDRLYGDVLQMLALAGTRWDVTLTLGGGNALLLRDEPERLADDKFRAFTPEWTIRWSQANTAMERAGDRGLRGDRVAQLASVGAAYRRGVKFLAGTDPALANGVFTGSSLHWELEHLVQAGVPPLDVLRIATQEGAAAVGAEDELGTLEVGKLADIVLLDANPLEDIKNTQTIWRVIKGGWVFDPEALRPASSAGEN